jgi:hypothetical protein
MKVVALVRFGFGPRFDCSGLELAFNIPRNRKVYRLLGDCSDRLSCRHSMRKLTGISDDENRDFLLRYPEIRDNARASGGRDQCENLSNH